MRQVRQRARGVAGDERGAGVPAGAGVSSAQHDLGAAHLLGHRDGGRELPTPGAPSGLHPPAGAKKKY
eukprot:31472-Prorocentrum_minimum.AAC.1